MEAADSRWEKCLVKLYQKPPSDFFFFLFKQLRLPVEVLFVCKHLLTSSGKKKKLTVEKAG